VLVTTVRNLEGKARDTDERFHADPICRSTAEEHVRHAINMVTAMAVRRAANDFNGKRAGIMIWVARALAAVAVMMLIYALILRFWPY
jgi:hypothetical protein